MLPSVTLNKAAENPNLIGSRAYTFLDAYAHERNYRYNFMYEQYKEILAIENNAIQLHNPEILYEALIKHAKLTDSIIDRVRKFVINIKQDVLTNVQQIMPSTDKVNEWDEVINAHKSIMHIKYIDYHVSPIIYPAINDFFNLFKQELGQCISYSNTDNMATPQHTTATSFLLINGARYSTINNELLNMETIKSLNLSRAINIINFFKHKAQVVQTINADFTTIRVFLYQFKFLQKLIDSLKPVMGKDGFYTGIDGNNTIITFDTYMMIYRHSVSILRYLIDMVNNYDKKFFCKIQAVQSNIGTYKALLSDAPVSDVSEVEPQTESVDDEGYNNLVDGKSQAAGLLMDETKEEEEEVYPKDILTEDKIKDGDE